MYKQNIVGWFEIPTKDLSRAKKFYESVFNVQLQDTHLETGTQMAIFPGGPAQAGAMGALIHAQDTLPSASGTVVYFSCEDMVSKLKHIEDCEGSVLLPKTSIGEHGFIAHFQDTEGNRVALHAMQ